MDGAYCAHLGVLADDPDLAVEEEDDLDGVGEEDNRGGRPRLGLELPHLLRICKLGKARCRRAHAQGDRATAVNLTLRSSVHGGRQKEIGGDGGARREEMELGLSGDEGRAI